MDIQETTPEIVLEKTQPCSSHVGQGHGFVTARTWVKL